MHWHQLFIPDTGLTEIAETVVRGTVMFWLIVVLMRILRREVGGIGTIDVLVIVVIADAAQNGLAGPYTTITTGAALVVTIAFWAWASDRAAYHFKAWRKIAEPQPLQLIKNGKLIEDALESVLLTHDELWAGLRKSGVDSLKPIKGAWLETDGHISVILR
jgi:uncharacterized membrane protein YcaP (DUF421 family)